MAEDALEIGHASFAAVPADDVRKIAIVDRYGSYRYVGRRRGRRNGPAMRPSARWARSLCFPAGRCIPQGPPAAPSPVARRNDRPHATLAPHPPERRWSCRAARGAAVAAGAAPPCHPPAPNPPMSGGLAGLHPVRIACRRVPAKGNGASARRRPLSRPVPDLAFFLRHREGTGHAAA